MLQRQAVIGSQHKTGLSVQQIEQAGDEAVRAAQQVTQVTVAAAGVVALQRRPRADGLHLTVDVPKGRAGSI